MDIARECHWAKDPDVTGCDCTCTLPPPRGFWRRLAWRLTPMSRVCNTGHGGCGDGRLPCRRRDDFLKGAR